MNNNLDETSDLLLHNKLQIELINHKCLKTRIRNEYKELSNIYTNINNNYTLILIYDTELHILKITIMENLKNINNEYTFIIDSNYPFHSPIFHFNNKHYLQYLKLPSIRFSEQLKKITNEKCLCCSSLCCKYKWSPGIKLHMFIDELNKIRQHKRNIVYKILSDHIKDKYLIDDVDINCFLFTTTFKNSPS